MEAITCKVDNQGRITLPRDWRRAQALATGSEVVVTVEADQLAVCTRKQSLSAAQALVAQYKNPGESVVDEFLAGRRQEAQLEEEDASRHEESL
jgi:AbrB family looped-hinge helix DNA binding protein